MIQTSLNPVQTHSNFSMSKLLQTCPTVVKLIFGALDQNLMKLGEVVVHIKYYSFTKFHYILMKKIIILYQTHLTDGPSFRGR